MAVTPGRAGTPPVPVFVARGIAGWAGLARLRADPGIRVVASPRHATVLVVTGAIPAAHHDALARVHDQIPSPRGVAVLGHIGFATDLGLGAGVADLGVEDPLSALHALHVEVVAGHAGHPALGPADNPMEWQGVGPHGQGGEGMMGGTPYGRMMPMPPIEGRDGLALDRLSLSLGPFLPGWPAGVVADVGLQGDVLEEVALVPAERRDLPVNTRVHTPGEARGEVTVLLGALAELCALTGLGALARRAARLALHPQPAEIERLRRRLDRRWGLRAATDGVGRLADGRDVTARWRAWLNRVGDLLAGRPVAVAGDLDPEAVAEALRGQELGRAWLTLASLQPDFETLAPTTPAAAS